MKTIKSSRNEVQVKRAGKFYIAYCGGCRVRSGKSGTMPDVMTKAELTTELREQFDATIARRFDRWA